MKVASYIFYALAVLSALAGIAAASFAKDTLGQVFGSGALLFYGSATVVSALIGFTCQRLAERKY
ncbi:MAG: hypothetical protein ACR2NL_03275 [Acidimicrobiia bacterium]